MNSSHFLLLSQVRSTLIEEQRLVIEPSFLTEEVVTFVYEEANMRYIRDIVQSIISCPFLHYYNFFMVILNGVIYIKELSSMKRH